MQSELYDHKQFWKKIQMLMVLSVPLNNYQNLPLLEALYFSSSSVSCTVYNKETNNQSQDLDVRDA